MVIGLDALQENLTGAVESVKGFISEKPITSAIVGGAVVGTTALGIIKAVKSRKAIKKKRKSITKKKAKN